MVDRLNPVNEELLHQATNKALEMLLKELENPDPDIRLRAVSLLRAFYDD